MPLQGQRPENGRDRGFVNELLAVLGDQFAAAANTVTAANAMPRCAAIPKRKLRSWVARRCSSGEANSARHDCRMVIYPPPTSCSDKELR